MKNKPASSIVVSLGKTLRGTPRKWQLSSECERPVQNIAIQFAFSSMEDKYGKQQKKITETNYLMISLFWDLVQPLHIYICSINGTALDLSLGLTMANFFLTDLETQLLQSILNCFPKIYHKYIDDIFNAHHTECSCVEFLDLLNSQHRSTKFTVEKTFDTLSFLIQS